MVEDVLDALKWISNHGHKHGLDANKVVIMGGSAGAHLGLMAAYLHNKRLKVGVGATLGVLVTWLSLLSLAAAAVVVVILRWFSFGVCVFLFFFGGEG
jgi:acetyl esterase/lipase